MGALLSCCKPSSSEYTVPEIVSVVRTQETRRKQMAEAAEKRLKEQESRGIKDPEKVKRQQQRAEEMERRAEEASKQGGQGGLKWQVET
ncbi:hypothetical protein J437_LFUL011741 [Ladona fulva]|uniref:Small VCP/p97-interacting protein n=1 Tax=Ladona fulva TaxID=123851 RepID=A0A8K0KBX9_LADFU|nr:hypothetical protein J437_LFUL011741 [Ladona fulva]